MTKALTFLAALVVGPVLLAGALATLAAGALASPPGGTPTGEAVADIPAAVLPVYVAAAQTCPGLSWSVLAGVGKVESDHARHGDAHLDANLNVRAPIIGIPLDGSNGTAAIPDTDNGRLDGDPVWDRAVGPMQFIPATWAAHATDGNGDGVADPHNYADAIHTATAYLCHNGAGDPATLRTAILAYNHADWYADQVLAYAERYVQAAQTIPVPGGGQVVGDYALPVNRDLLTPELLDRPHHDYPAWDLAIAEGTPVYAVAAGTVLAVTADAGCGNGVIIHGSDDARYTYCHGAAADTTAGADVAAGQQIMRSGNTGRSTGPHLHLQIHNPAGQLVCPQPLLQALYAGQIAPSPAALPTSGCAY